MKQLHRSPAHRFVPLLALLVLLSALPFASTAPVARAATIVPVRYDAFNKIIYLGDDYNPADPAQAPYVGYPSAAGAPKAPITVPEVAAALVALGQTDLLTGQGTIWTLKANLVISQTARLDATSATISELRLDSSPARGFPALTTMTAFGGALNIDGIHVLSWDGSGPDTNYYDGRSYLLAADGARMDVLNAEVTNLGWGAGEPSGLAWRQRGTTTVPDDIPTKDMNIIRTGSTGSILNSNIHDNYFGQYSFEAYGLIVKNNEFHHNAYYGFDPHDYSTGFEVAYNKVYNNGKHGIIFSRGCTLNRIHDNEVYGNAEHGIMMDRGSDINQITNNLVYNNQDGVAIFQSEKNLIQNNTLRGNERGVRINATFDQGDVFDGLSNENVVLGNRIEDSTQYGIYLYERADKNAITGNTVLGSVGSGLYIKTGGNTISGNTIRTNGTGITIVAGDPITVGSPSGTPAYQQPSYDSGHKNTIRGNTISDNNSIGIQLKGAVDTTIGLDGPNATAADANTINTNGTHGISIDVNSVVAGGTTTVYGATKNLIIGNTIQGNQSDGVLVKGAESIKNKISRNSITANARKGIDLAGGNLGLAAPTVTITSTNATTVGGTAAVNGGTVEVYRDNGGQGAVYIGKTTVKADLTWSFTLPAGDSAANGAVTALLIDGYGNTSPFGGGNAVGGDQASYTIGAGANGETTVFISGPGANVTLPTIQAALQVISPTAQLLVQEDANNKVWMSNVSLFVNRGVTLTLDTDTVSWLKLRSQAGQIAIASAGDSPSSYDYKSFTKLRTYNGVIKIDGKTSGIKISSWDPAKNGFDTDINNGRSYLLAKYNARMDITNADLSYLGSADGESYGVAWRDINSTEQPDLLLTRVTGNVLNSVFSNDYYGIYTFQAQNMVFRGNKFHHNIGYGFDPHDFSHHFTVEDNESFENGNHGFIISRGCNNFTFRRNISHDNHYTIGTEDRKAHGFILDPGSPNSRFPQAASHDNLLDNNQAYGNDGYGLRVVGSINNTFTNNTFTNNLQGMTFEQASTGNKIDKNTITGSGLYGIYLFGASDQTTITNNTITKSGKHGIYIKTGKNTITGNTVTDNGSVVNGVGSGSGIATLRESDVIAATADLTLPGARTSIAVEAPELVATTQAVSDVDSNALSGNTVARNADEGIELKSATNTRVEANTVTDNGSNGVYLSVGAGTNMLKKNVLSGNHGYGIRANGSDVFGNTWTENQVFKNLLGGIVTTSSANNGIKAPVLTRNSNVITGTALPGATVELFSDDAGQGRYFETRVTAGADGRFRVARAWKGAIVNAVVTDQDKNSSGFTINMGVGTNKLFLPITGRS